MHDIEDSHELQWRLLSDIPGVKASTRIAIGSQTIGWNLVEGDVESIKRIRLVQTRSYIQKPATAGKKESANVDACLFTNTVDKCDAGPLALTRFQSRHLRFEGVVV